MRSRASPPAAPPWTARWWPRCSETGLAPRPGAQLDSLTPRERETLELIAQGRSNAAIARQLVVTLGAVEKHVSSIFGKLDLPVTDDDHRRVLAVLAYLQATDGSAA